MIDYVYITSTPNQNEFIVNLGSLSDSGYEHRYTEIVNIPISNQRCIDSYIINDIINFLSKEYGYKIASNCVISFNRNHYLREDDTIVLPVQHATMVKVQQCDIYGNVNNNIDPSYHIMYSGVNTNTCNKLSEPFKPTGSLHTIKNTLNTTTGIDSQSTILMTNLEQNHPTTCQMIDGEVFIPAHVTPVIHDTNSISKQTNGNMFNFDIRLGKFRISRS